ncbi:hypothetical protein HHK36_007803 [Tetracentron sinense]|uniref:Uncharacterized protein n=1 Tax=Tetracentron sinense TaxID=13715 RepID=A0A834ZL66_TETSI|nr:hypothetical protein HHK36_007803 [Tetracentron sinense]
MFRSFRLLSRDRRHTGGDILRLLWGTGIAGEAEGTEAVLHILIPIAGYLTFFSTGFLKEATAIVQLESVIEWPFSCLTSSLLAIRRQHEAELKLIEEETARRVEEAIRKIVEESLNSQEIKLEIQRQLEEGQKKLIDEVAAQLEKEKEAALVEARQKEEQVRSEREELDMILEENRRRVEEAQRKEALERQRKEEERYWELEQIQRQKEEAMQRKKLVEEEERANQVKLLGKNKSRPKFSFAIGSK